jgi:hypothetical protein
MSNSSGQEIPVDDLFKADAISNISAFIEDEFGIDCSPTGSAREPDDRPAS